ARSAMESAAQEGADSSMWWPPEDQWRKTKKGGYYRLLNGATVSVKQAKSGAWYAVSMTGCLLGESTVPTWFVTSEGARNAVDEAARGSTRWSWIRPQ